MCIVNDRTKYETFAARLQTFDNWVGPTHPVMLASAGFYFLKRGDVVRCFKCGIELNDWKPTDIPLSEHIKWNKYCEYISQVKCQSSLFNNVILQTIDIYSKQNPVKQNPAKRCKLYNISTMLSFCCNIIILLYFLNNINN